MGEMIERPDDAVPKGALVQCPLRQGAPVLVHPTCTGCEHHRAVGELEELVNAPNVTWSQSHRIRCGLVRTLIIMEIVD